MSWFYLALGSIFSLAMAELIQQKIIATDKEYSSNTTLFVTFIVQALIALPIIFLLGLSGQFFHVFNAESLPYFSIVAILGVLSMQAYYKSFDVKNISISIMLMSLSIVVSTFLGIVLLNESLYLLKIVGLLLVLASIFILSFNNFHVEKNNFFGLLAGLFFGLSYTFDKIVVLNTHPIIYMFWLFFSVSTITFLIFNKKIVSEIKDSTLNTLKPVFVSGIGFSLYNFFTFTAYSKNGEVGRIDAINNAEVFVLILAEYLILKKTEGIKRKLLAATVAFAGVFILGFY